MSKYVKATTRLTGLAVAKNPHHILKAIYGKISRTLAKMPENAAYRKFTDQIVKDRLAAVEKHQNVSDLEKAINCGQVEEVIVQAENELLLARKMLIWKPWEPLVQQAPDKQWDWPPARITEPKV